MCPSICHTNITMKELKYSIPQYMSMQWTGYFHLYVGIKATIPHVTCVKGKRLIKIKRFKRLNMSVTASFDDVIKWKRKF